MMFKSFKQDRRVSSVVFTHDQDLLNEVNKVAGGKENTPKMGPPNGPPPRATPLVSSRTNAEKAKEVKGKMSRGGPKMSEPAPEDTTQAFDRLLVRLRPIGCGVVVDVLHRTTYKYHKLSDQN